MKKQRKNRLRRLAKKKHERKQLRRPELPTMSGIISITPGGLGFVALPADESGEPQPDVFIPSRFLKSAMHGDEVQIQLLPPRHDSPQRDDLGPAGKVVEIINHARESIVGELLAGHKVRPLNKRIPEDIKLSGSLNGARRGEWVEIKLLHANDGESAGRRGNIVSRLGRAGEIVGDLDAICKEFKLPSPYSEQDEEAAAKLQPRKIDRKDFRQLFCVTIDPHDAKDFDDAVSIAPGEDDNELELGVHIADVAAWIKPDGKWDNAALEHAFTAYLPGRTLPMLPKSLTAKISLTPDGDAMAHSVFMTVHAKSGRILRCRRGHSFIRITKRLTFGEVQQYINGQTDNDWPEEFRANMDQLVKLFKTMREYRRRNEKFLEMSIPETRVLCDEKTNKIIRLERKEQQEADQLVEEFMLAANTAVAIEMIEKGIPGIYRVHPEPDPDKIEEFTALCVQSFGITPGDLSSRSACNQFLQNLPDGPRKPAILSAFLRSLPRACYQEIPELHFGLGKTRYSHFTSPIRRYPDLLVHQQLWEDEVKGKLRSKKTAGIIAADCSRKEMNNDDAYYTANDRLKLRYLEEELAAGKENLHEGIIAKITSAGLLVDIQDIGIYGFVPIENLPGAFRRYGNMFKAIRGSKSFKSGDYIYLKLSQIDFVRGAAIFKLA